MQFTTDDNVIEFDRQIEKEAGVKLKELKLVYKYIKSSTKLGQELSMPQSQVEKMLKDKILIPFIEEKPQKKRISSLKK